MFERFTDRARRVLVGAQEEAARLGHGFIGTEHILLGILDEPEGVGALALADVGIEATAARERIVEVIGTGDDAGGKKVPFTPRAKKVLELSLREALKLGHSYIGTEHLLLGLVRESKGVAAQVITHFGVGEEQVRQAVLARLEQVTEGGGESGRGPRRGRRGRRRSAAVEGEAPDMTPGAQIVLGLARRTATGEDRERISSTDLLLGCTDRDTQAGRVLASLGVTEERLREAVAATDAAGTLDEPRSSERDADTPAITFHVEGVEVRIHDGDLADRLAAAMSGGDPGMASNLRDLLGKVKDLAARPEEPDDASSGGADGEDGAPSG